MKGDSVLFSFVIIVFTVSLLTIYNRVIMVDKNSLNNANIIQISDNKSEITWESTSISNNTIKYKAKFTYNSSYLNYYEFLSFLNGNNEDFIINFNEIIANFKSTGLFFETVPITKNTLRTKTFEFVLISTSEFDSIDVDSLPFRDKFTSNLVVTFNNIRNDAKLIVPCPSADDIKSNNFNQYKNLANFVRSSDKLKIIKFWSTVGGESLNILSSVDRIEDEKLWISTSGLGVFWLHIRLDKRPKYYNYQPYKS